MCDACVMEVVKGRLSRRGFLSGAVASAAGGAVLSASALSATANVLPESVSFSNVIDLTQTLTPDFPTFEGGPAFEESYEYTFAKDGLNLKTLHYHEHVGTHFDAPIHVSKDGQSIDEIPIEKFVCPLAVIDVRDQAANNPDYRVMPEDILAYEQQHGRIPDRACVAMLSGWPQYVGTEKYRGEDSKGVLHFPGFHEETAKFLINERSVYGLGADTLSIDYGPTKDFPVHYLWLGSGRYGIENLTNLDQVPLAGATIIAGAPKFKGGTGGPGRVLAVY